MQPAACDTGRGLEKGGTRTRRARPQMVSRFTVVTTMCTIKTLFDPTLRADESLLDGSLFKHAVGVEQVLLSAGQSPGSYTALEVLQIAATLMAMPESRDGFPRFLPPPEQVPEHAYRAVPPEDDPIPF
jgi:hypothetical protein